MTVYNLLLFILTLAGGSAPLWLKGINDKRTNYLLAFSGSFLLSITLLHLLPETFEERGHTAGLFVLAGFFIQLLIQRFTHGVEHGHTHIEGPNSGHHHHHDHDHHHDHPVQTHAIPLLSIILGLSVHAFMEGLPLGFNYRMEATESSLYLAVAAHKLPEAMLLTSLVMAVKGKTKAFWVLLVFALITPMASVLASFFSLRYFVMSELVKWVIPIVAGAFIHIATTIFFESGTRQHLLTWQKTIAIILGVGIGLTTLFFE
jgi:zinc transporter ZupT